MYATFWALMPPIVAIVLALITKEVYSSLLIGIAIGALFYANFSLEGALVHMLGAGTETEPGGLLMVLSDSYNMGILPDEQSRRFCCFRTLGRETHPQPCRRSACYHFTGLPDLY